MSFTKNDVTLDSGGVGRGPGYKNITLHKSGVGDAGSTQNDVWGTLEVPSRLSSVFFLKIAVFQSYGGPPTMILWDAINTNLKTLAETTESVSILCGWPQDLLKHAASVPCVWEIGVMNLRLSIYSQSGQFIPLPLPCIWDTMGSTLAFHEHQMSIITPPAK